MTRGAHGRPVDLLPIVRKENPAHARTSRGNNHVAQTGVRRPRASAERIVRPAARRGYAASVEGSRDISRKADRRRAGHAQGTGVRTAGATGRCTQGRVDAAEEGTRTRKE